MEASKVIQATLELAHLAHLELVKKLDDEYLFNPLLTDATIDTDDSIDVDDLTLFDWLKETLFKTEAAFPARYLINTFQNKNTCWLSFDYLEDSTSSMSSSTLWDESTSSTPSSTLLEELKVIAPDKRLYTIALMLLSELHDKGNLTETEAITTNPADHVCPDIYVSRVNNDWIITPNEKGIPKLRVFDEIISSYKGELKAYLEESLHNAAWLIKSVQIRQEILVTLTKQLCEFQKDSLIDQSTQPLPKGLTTVAKSTGLHPSVVSCIAQNKVIGMQESTVSFSSLLTS